MGQLGRLAHLLDELMLRAALRRERQHGDARLLEVAECAGGVCRRHRDVRKLLSVRTRVHHAVRENKKPILPKLRKRPLQKESGRDEFHPRRGPDDLHRRTKHVSCRMDGARHETVRIALLDHHHSVVHRIRHQTDSGLLGEALRFAEFVQCGGVCVETGLVLLARDNLGREQNRFRHAILRDDPCRLDRARFVALG